MHKDMRYARILVLLIAALGMAATVTSCKKEQGKKEEAKKENEISLEQKLLGTWEFVYDEESMSLLFKAGDKGTITFVTKEDGEYSDNLTWELNSSTKELKLTPENLPQMNGTFDGETLVVDGLTYNKTKK